MAPTHNARVGAFFVSASTPLPLSDGQRRHFAVLLELLEQSLNEMEEIAAHGGSSTRLRLQSHDLPGDFAATIAPHLAAVRREAYDLWARLGVQPREASQARRLHALVMACVVRLEDSTADKLAGYGDVHDAIAPALDPVIRRMHAELSTVAALTAAAEAG